MFDIGDFVRSQPRANLRARDRTFTRIPSAMRARVSQRTFQRTAIKVSMTAFFDAPRQFDFVFRRMAAPFLPLSFFSLRRVASPARRSKFYGSYFLFNADAASGTPDDSTRLCPSSTLSSPCPLPLSPAFSSFAAYRLFARAIVSRCCRIARINGCARRSSPGESGVGSGGWIKFTRRLLPDDSRPASVRNGETLED